MKEHFLGKLNVSPLPYLKRPSERVRDAIEDAIANGAFDNLPGAGQPLDLSDEDNPFVPSDLRLAYRMLRKHGYVLPWIDERREIEARRRDLEQRESWQLQRLRRRIDELPSLPAYLRPYRREKLLAEHDEFARRHLEAIGQLNDKIDRYNLAVPNLTLQTHRMSSTRARERLREALVGIAP